MRRADAELASIIQRVIDDVNRTVSKAEAVKRFRLLAERFEVSDELTPTQSVRREYVLTKFVADIDALHAHPGSEPT